jgi:hypothetical protein
MEADPKAFASLPDTLSLAELRDAVACEALNQNETQEEKKL